MNVKQMKKKMTRGVLWRTIVLLTGATILYYMPTISVIIGFASKDGLIYSLHSLYGIDLYAMVFFIPVAYSAYSSGIKLAFFSALFSMIVLFPYSLTQSHLIAMLQPAALGIILAAVGSAIAMLQRSDEYSRQRIQELSCLENVGSAANSKESVDAFLEEVAGILERSIPDNIGVRLTLNGKDYGTSSTKNAKFSIEEELPASGEKPGSLTVFYPCKRDRQRIFIKTLAERISGAVREIELQHSLNLYYQGLEEIVDKRTKELESAQEKLVRSERLAAIGELASAVSHELRNPLNVIQNCVYLLNLSLEDSSDEEVKNTLQMIRQQVTISNRIVTDLLDFTRAKPPVLNTVNIRDVLKETLSTIQIPDRIRFVNNCGDLFITADGDQIGRAFTNIIVNAIQAIKDTGEIVVTSRVQGDKVSIEFRDTGCGIPEENLSRIFEPLFTTKTRGIGLGLAITKRLVEANGGSITVESQVGKGAIFTIMLPLLKKGAIDDAKSAQFTGSR